MADPNQPTGPDAKALRARALRWLALREHSPAELRRKLLRLGGPEALVDELLGRLQADGHLSEARFVASRIRLRAPRYGTQRIAAELRQRGAAPDAASLDALRATELSRAAAIWARRFGRAASDPRERARQARFLLQRGFSGEVVRRVVGGLEDLAAGETALDA